jgi:tetratricopeptide (TPR) repeat protein
VEATLLHRLTCILVVAAAVAAPADPARADDAADAKAHYQKATAHYAVGEYKDAANEYEAAFKIKQDPALLYNAAQSHRLAGDNQKALLLYKNLVKLYPSTKFAAEAKGRIEKLEQAIATSQSPPNNPAPVDAGPMAMPDRPTTVSPPPAAPPPAAAPAPTAATLVAAPPPPAQDQRRPIYKQWWFWAGAGAVAVVAIVVVVAASSGGGGAWANVPDVRAAITPGVRW